MDLFLCALMIASSRSFSFIKMTWVLASRKTGATLASQKIVATLRVISVVLFCLGHHAILDVFLAFTAASLRLDSDLTVKFKPGSADARRCLLDSPCETLKPPQAGPQDGLDPRTHPIY